MVNGGIDMFLENVGSVNVIIIIDVKARVLSVTKIVGEMAGPFECQ